MNANTSLNFELPESQTAEKFLKKLQKKVNLHIESQHYAIKTFYDSFDWRLYNAGIICEQNQSQKNSQLSLIDRNKGYLIARESIQDVPNFSEQLTQSSLKSQLSPLLEMRALLLLCQLPHQIYRINILNKDQKIILRIQLDEYELLANRLSLHPLKGYEKAVKNVTEILINDLDLKATHNTILNAALKLQGRKPKDYSSKLAIKLEPDMRADQASIIIYQQLLNAIKTNESGTIADIDSEFLHDFRVAVRRTRAGLSQIKNTLAPETIAHHANFFAWLGQITGATRDLDVYLLSYKNYQAALPESLQSDISPLYDFLKKKQVQAQYELAEKLKSKEYRVQLDAWEHYLKSTLPTEGTGLAANINIKKLADQRIWKVYKRLMKEADAINEHSPANALHDLRKTCKKLRYLMEFFTSLYPENEMKSLIKALKGFQSVLGDFQDYEVQETSIKQFSEEMAHQNIPTNTFLAMGVLVQYLDTMKRKARSKFNTQFDLFQQAEIKASFKRLFAHSNQVKKS